MAKQPDILDRCVATEDAFELQLTQLKAIKEEIENEITSDYFLEQLQHYTLNLLKTFTNWSTNAATLSENTGITSHWDRVKMRQEDIPEFTALIAKYLHDHPQPIGPGVTLLLYLWGNRSPLAA